ncbi:uncharacterized protein [Chelonus insularis]|uniref:uncharacterized protein n=1 Tax=Chelonus insularis TaxID=460826 RepID=UPI0015898D5F|nr:uncharacterized protein LOC118065356 [Chelonus insularis]
MSKSRDIWLPNEVDKLLELFKEEQIADLMDSKQSRVDDVFKSFEKKLNYRGVVRPAKQIKNKYKSLKQSYNATRRALSQSGAGTSVKCPYYNKLHEIFGHRPVSVQCGVDSASIVQNQKNQAVMSLTSPDIEMSDDISVSLDDAVPSSSKDVGLLSNTIKLSSLQSITIEDKTDIIESNINCCAIENIVANSNVSDNNNNFDKKNETDTEKIEKNNLKKIISDAKRSVVPKKKQSFGQIFDKAIDRLINANKEQLQMAVDSNNKLVLEIMEKKRKCYKSKLSYCCNI